MGMYDYVNFKTKCPNCKELLEDFQTKDYICSMCTTEPENIDRFYCSCSCGYWIEYSRVRKHKEFRKRPRTEKQVLALGFKKSCRPMAKPS